MSALIRTDVVRAQHSFHLRLRRMLSTRRLIRMSIAWRIVLRSGHLFLMQGWVSRPREDLPGLHIIVVIAVFRVDFLRRDRRRYLLRRLLLLHDLLIVIRGKGSVIVALLAMNLIRFDFLWFFWNVLFIVGFRKMLIQSFQATVRQLNRLEEIRRRILISVSVICGDRIQVDVWKNILMREQ